MAPAKKTAKKKKSDGPRSRKYGCVTYNSEPQDNPDCHKGRCSPPARMISQDGTTKVTQIRYRRRNLDVVSKNCACSLKPASKTKKSAGSKTVKAPAKSKTVKAPTVKKTASKVKAPAKPKAPAKVKAPAKPTVKKTATEVSTINVYDKLPSRLIPTFSKSPLTMAINHSDFLNKDYIRLKRDFNGNGTPIAEIVNMIQKRPDLNVYYEDIQLPLPRKDILKILKARPEYKSRSSAKTTAPVKKTPAKAPAKPKAPAKKVKEAILDKAAKEGMNRKELSKHLVVASVPKQTAKKEPAKAPAKKSDVFKDPPLSSGDRISKVTDYSNPDLPGFKARWWYITKSNRLNPPEYIVTWKYKDEGGSTIRPWDYQDWMIKEDLDRIVKRIIEKKQTERAMQSAKAPAKPKAPAKKVKEAILDKAAKEGMNRKELSKHLVVASVPKQTAKKEPAKAPASSPGKTMLPPSMYGPNMSPGYVGKFDGASLKRLAKAINVLYGTSLAVPLPLFDVPATFANQSKTMLLSVWGFNGKATSLVGCPPANKHFAVDMARVVNQIGNGECDFGIGGELGPNKVRFLTQGSKIDVPVSDKYSDSKTLVENLDNYLTQGYDVNEYKTTAQRFVQDLKKVVTVQRGKQQNVDKDSAINVCPNGKLSKADNGADRQCGQFSNYLLYRAVKILQLANKQECIVTTRPGYPIRIHFHIGKYVADLYIAPMQIQ